MTTSDDKKLHRKFGVALFNQTWDLIDKENRTQEEIDRMIHSAHASRFHWGIAGTPLNIARGEWQVSHVYAILNRIEPCLYHAKRCLQITLEHGFQDFDLAFAYEAMARGYSLASDKVETAKYVELAKDAAIEIKDPDDRKYFLSQLATIHSTSSSTT